MSTYRFLGSTGSLLILHRMALCLFGNFVALHLENSYGKTCTSNQCGTVSLFLSILTCCILNLLTSRLYLSLQDSYLSISLLKLIINHWGKMVLEWSLGPHII